jgi:hypothetical protein
MVDIADPSDIAAKWSDRAGSASNVFQEGVSRSSDSEWASATADAEDSWSDGVQDAATEGRFASGVANTEKSWKERTMTLGTQRYSSGVRESQEEYEQGFAPYADEISSTTLSPRGARGDQQNYERSREMGEALHQARLNR